MTTPEHHPFKVCIILPAYREEKRIASVIKAILPICRNIVVIDDGSPDGTSAEATQAGSTVLRHDVNQGKGAALNTGFHYAQEHHFDVVITLDSDGQHDPSEISKFIEAYQRTGIPVLVGNRMFDPQAMPIVRRTTNRFMSWMLSRLMHQYVPDTQCGYRLFRCDILPFVSANSQRFAAESEILLNLAHRGIRIDSVRISTIYRDEKSKINPFLDTFRFFSMVLRHRRSMKR